MKVNEHERQAIIAVLKYGETYGFGNMIAHLQTAWAKHLIDVCGFTEEQATYHAGVHCYPLKMQADIVERGEYDETGERYAEVGNVSR